MPSFLPTLDFDWLWSLLCDALPAAGVVSRADRVALPLVSDDFSRRQELSNEAGVTLLGMGGVAPLINCVDEVCRSMSAAACCSGSGWYSPSPVPPSTEGAWLWHRWLRSLGALVIPRIRGPHVTGHVRQKGPFSLPYELRGALDCFRVV